MTYSLAFIAPDGIAFRITGDSTPLALKEGTNGLLDCHVIPTFAQGDVANIEAQMLSGKFAFYGVRSPLYDLTFYEYQRQWIEFASRELSSGPDYAFRLNPDTGEPCLWIHSPGGATEVDALMTISHKDLKTIPDYEEIRVRKLAVAAARMTLGETRSKYETGIPAANQTIKLNGQKMVNDGKAAWDEEEAKLRSSVMADQLPIWA